MLVHHNEDFGNVRTEHVGGSIDYIFCEVPYFYNERSDNYLIVTVNIAIVTQPH